MLRTPLSSNQARSIAITQFALSLLDGVVPQPTDFPGLPIPPTPHEQAAFQLRYALELDPENAKALTALGELIEDQEIPAQTGDFSGSLPAGHIAQAAALYRRARSHAEAIMHIAILIKKQKIVAIANDFSSYKIPRNISLQCASLARAAIKTNPDCADALYLLATLIHTSVDVKASQYDFPNQTAPRTVAKKTAALLRRALHIDPDHPAALFYLANLLLRNEIQAILGDFPHPPIPKTKPEQAAVLLRRILRNDSFNNETLTLLGLLIGTNQVAAKPEDFLQTTVPNHPSEQAALLYREVLSRNPNYISALNNLAVCIQYKEVKALPTDFHFSNRPMPSTPNEQAIALYQHILNIEPSDTTARRNLNTLLKPDPKKRRPSNFFENLHNKRQKMTSEKSAPSSIFSKLPSTQSSPDSDDEAAELLLRLKYQ